MGSVSWSPGVSSFNWEATILGCCLCPRDECYGLKVCVPTNPHVEALTPNLIVFWGEAFGKWLGLDETTRAGPPWRDKCPHKKRKRPELNLSTTWRHSKVTICKPGGGFSPELDATGTLTLDFQPPDCEEHNCLSHHVSGIFVIAACVD